MSRSTIAVVDSKRLLELFGPRDQHLRKIRTALDVGISARDGEIHIEGDNQLFYLNSDELSAYDYEKEVLLQDGIAYKVVDRKEIVESFVCEGKSYTEKVTLIILSIKAGKYQSGKCCFGSLRLLVD